MSRVTPITTAYQALLSKGRLKPNAGQAALVKQLGLLQDKLTESSSILSIHLPWQTQQSPSHNNHEASKSRQGSSSGPKGTSEMSGIYIHGAVGTGKSHIANLFTKTLPSHITKRRTHFFEFLTDTHIRLHQARSLSNYKGDPLVQIGKQISRESQVLYLDEFQVNDIADAMILKRLFTGFWNGGGVLVSTSNRAPDELYKDGLNRDLFLPFIGELKGRCVVHEVQEKKDYRMESRNLESTGEGRGEVWMDVVFTDEKAFREDLDRRLNGRELEEIEIQVVMNRKIIVQATTPEEKGEGEAGSKLVASSTFKQLCEKSLGPTDYHALCSRADTIYLTGLRQFRADELDVVRRFITLVDVAYESKTRMICLSTHSLLDTFKNIVTPEELELLSAKVENKSLKVKGEGGSSSSMMSTFIGEMEWSATGLKEASLATGGAGEKDVRFAIGRAISRLTEMGSLAFQTEDVDS